jgi:hypothetical protein
MAAKKAGGGKPKSVRKTVTLEEEKLAKARKYLKLDSDAEVLRVALDHLLSHFEHPHAEEE